LKFQSKVSKGYSMDEKVPGVRVSPSDQAVPAIPLWFEKTLKKGFKLV